MFLLNRSPLLTVVIPLYNVELYVADAIGSILNQEFDDYEIIVINDGSQDRSVDVVKQMMQTEERICLYHQENRGLHPPVTGGWISPREPTSIFLMPMIC